MVLRLFYLAWFLFSSHFSNGQILNAPKNRPARSSPSSYAYQHEDVYFFDTPEFNYHTRANMTNVNRYFTFSGVAYCPKEKILNKTCKNCSILKPTIIYKVWGRRKFDNSTVIVIDPNYKEVIVSFTNQKFIYAKEFTSLSEAGIQSSRDAQVDAEELSHTIRTTDLISITLINIFKKSKYKKYSLVLTGHSYGGVTAMLAAPFLKRLPGVPKSTIAIYTYGQCRVGNQPFANWYNSEFPYYYHIINGRDIHTHTNTLNSGYYHAGQEIFITDEGDAIYCQRFKEDPNCSNQFINFNFYYDNFMGTSDIDRYCNQ